MDIFQGTDIKTEYRKLNFEHFKTYCYAIWWNGSLNRNVILNDI